MTTRLAPQKTKKAELPGMTLTLIMLGCPAFLRSVGVDGASVASPSCERYPEKVSAIAVGLQVALSSPMLSVTGESNPTHR